MVVVVVNDLSPPHDIAAFFSSVLRIVSCCMRRADTEDQDAFLGNLLKLSAGRGTDGYYAILATALGAIRNGSPLLSAIINDPEPLSNIARIASGTTTIDLSSEPPVPVHTFDTAELNLVVLYALT